MFTFMESTKSPAKSIEMKVLLEMQIGSPLGQFRTAVVNLGPKLPRAYAAFYSSDYDIDASVEMFAYPRDTLKMMLFTEDGTVLWKRELGTGLIPGGCYCPFFAFDLNGDGTDEIWFVNNIDDVHPFGISSYRLERVDALTGETTGQWQWPNYGGKQYLGYMFRNYILGGYVKGQPVLLTAQGTYESMFFQAWNPDIREPRWKKSVAKEDPGARGTHMSPVADMNNDGIDEFIFGERCIELDKGTELFCAGIDTWHGHSDMCQPIYDRTSGRWHLYTNRESDEDQPPRVVLYDDKGDRVWGAVEHGHIHKGWVGRIGEDGGLLATAIRIGGQTKGPSGRFYKGVEEFVFDAMTGQPVQLPYSVFDTAPIDIDGDGLHEIARGVAIGDVEIVGRDGSVIHQLGGRVSMASKLMNHPGEQMLCFYPDGIIRIWGDANAEDSPEALRRYAHPFYKINQKFPTNEYRLCMLGGI
jgi:hypothetical protein